MTLALKLASLDVEVSHQGKLLKLGAAFAGRTLAHQSIPHTGQEGVNEKRLSGVGPLREQSGMAKTKKFAAAVARGPRTV